jgi:hypothetical protein
MPQLLINGVKYHLAWRIIVRCQLRTMDAGHYVIATGESTCLPSDPFDEKEGKRKAFRALIKTLRSVGPESVVDDKRERRKVWNQFLFWLSGNKKPQLKMKPKPVKITLENQHAEGEHAPLRHSVPDAGFSGRNLSAGGGA